MNKAALKVRFSERPEGEATMSPEMAGAVNYYRWIVAQLSPYLKDKVLDIGGGFGSQLEYILPLCKEVTSIDLSGSAVEALGEKFGQVPGFRALQMDFGSGSPAHQELIDYGFQNIVILDVLEHIEDDAAALRDMHAILKAQQGVLLLKVPAHQWLYGSLDHLAGHYRRYHAEPLRESLNAAGFEVLQLYYFNAFGVLPWFINARLTSPTSLKSEGIGLQVRLFDRYFVPVLSRLESVVHPPIGQSLIAIARAV